MRLQVCIHTSFISRIKMDTPFQCAWTCQQIACTCNTTCYYYHTLFTKWVANRGNIRSAAFQFMETVYDTIVFLLVIFKTAQALRFTHTKQSIAVLITKHSLLYFAWVHAALSYETHLNVFHEIWQCHIFIKPRLGIDDCPSSSMHYLTNMSRLSTADYHRLVWLEILNSHVGT